MPKVFLCRRETFSASHRLNSHELSVEENRKTFGKCNNPNGHGHNYILDVTVKGEVDRVTGMVINISTLKQCIQEAVIERLDHKNIDLDVTWFSGQRVSTTENIAIFIWNSLREHALFPKELLWEVKLWETEKNFVIYQGE